MTIQIFDNIKGSEILDSLKEKIQMDPNQTYRIVIESEQEYAREALPNEESITEETIRAVQISSKDCQMGNYIECQNENELNNFFNQIKNDALSSAIHEIHSKRS